jgi:hypothetical protein
MLTRCLLDKFTSFVARLRKTNFPLLISDCAIGVSSSTLLEVEFFTHFFFGVSIGHCMPYCRFNFSFAFFLHSTGHIEAGRVTKFQHFRPVIAQGVSPILH